MPQVPQVVKAQAIEAAAVARPHARRAVVALAFVVAAVAGDAYIDGPLNVSLDADTNRLTNFGLAAVVAIAGVVAVRAVANGVRSVESSVGERRGTPLTFLVSVVGYLIVALLVFGIVGLRLRGLLVGGAVTGVVLGIAAQQTVGNFFAGIVLLVVRPFKLGDHLFIRSGALGGEHEGTVTDMGLFYLTLQTRFGPVALPNSGVLASAVGPGARTPSEEDRDKDDETKRDPGAGQGGTQAGGAATGG